MLRSTILSTHIIIASSMSSDFVLLRLRFQMLEHCCERLDEQVRGASQDIYFMWVSVLQYALPSGELVATIFPSAVSNSKCHVLGEEVRTNESTTKSDT